ncbi:MAG: hypothetical protein U0R19_41510 [Bryobacteraceae bacterium]
MLPYAAGSIPGPWMKMSVLSLPLIPLTWAYAIIRYRLMDVDVIFQQGYAYTLATVAVIGLFYAMVTSFNHYEELTPSAMVAMILISTFAFQPIRSWTQEQLDRYFFYKDRYDYRRTLTEFARELSSETDPERLMNSVIDRIKRTLGIKHAAVFLHGQDDSFRLTKTTRTLDQLTLSRLDLSFLLSQPTSASSSSNAPLRPRRRLAGLAGHGPPRHRRPRFHLLFPLHRARPRRSPPRPQPHR